MRTQGVTDRKLRVLHAIVELYIEDGEPVASRTVARRLSENLSPASIRNVMADLYEEGYLAQPHTSAGRIPTERAFQSYVRCLAVRRILSDELRRLRHELAEIGTLEGRIHRSSQILVEMTRGVGIAAAIPAVSQALDQVDLLNLADGRVLMVVVTRDQMVRNKVIHVADPVTQDELHSIRNYLNVNFSGWALTEIQHEVEQRLQHESAAYDAILRKLQVLCDSGLLELGLMPEIHMEGASNLVGLDLHLTREKLRELFRALEEKKKLLHILDRYLDDAQGEVGVQVGLASAHPAMGELSLIGVTVTLPGGVSSKIAVLGPMRMNYERVMSAVAHVGHALKAI
jgi:heat-inducible transcriptional repressor